MLEFAMMDEVTWGYIVLVFALLPWLWYGFIISFFIISLFYGRFKLYRPSDPLQLMDELPGVSILKPLMGVDPYLEYNLETHFLIKYPKFELLMCVADDTDPAVKIVRKLQERYPQVPSKLLIGGKDGILNPMVHNMTPAYEAAKYDLVWVSTSRIAGNTEILLDMVAKIQPSNVALVHQMPFTTDQQGLAATVEKVYFGTNVARYYMALHVLGISCFTGMSYLLKKDKLDEAHGLSYFGRFLAEDFFIAKILHERGYRHQLSAYPALQNVAGTSVAGYKDRMVRWMRLRLNMIPLVGGLLEPVAESVPLGIFMSWSVYHLFEINPYMWFVGHWTVWCILDYIQLRTVQREKLPFSFGMYLVAWLIRELLYLLIYFEAICNVRHIKWGKRMYRLSSFGESVSIVTDKTVLPI